MYRKEMTKIAATLAVIAVLAWSLTGCSGKDSDVSEVMADLVPVTVMVPGTVSISETSDYVAATSAKSTSVLNQVPGKVKTVHVEIGDPVEAGDILYEIDTEDVEQSIRDLELQMASVDTNIRNQDNNIGNLSGSQLDQQLNAARVQFENAKLDYNYAMEQYNDTLALYEKGYVALSQLEKAEEGIGSAALNYELKEDSYNTLLREGNDHSIDSARNQLNQQIISKERLDINLENAKDNLEDAVVRAEVSGVINSIALEAGDVLGVNYPAMEIVHREAITMILNVYENDVVRIHEGDVLMVEIPVLNDRSYQGTIDYISPAADERTMTFETKITIDNTDGAIKPGMIGVASVELLSLSNVMIVPSDAVLNDGDRQYVYTVGDDGLVHDQTVQTGIYKKSQTVITEGLESESLLIVKGQNYVDDGDNVRIVKSLTGQE